MLGFAVVNVREFEVYVLIGNYTRFHGESTYLYYLA